MASLGLLILQNWKFNIIGISPHGISGFADSDSFKDSTKRIDDLKAFSSVKLEIQQNTKGLLTMSRISNNISES